MERATVNVDGLGVMMSRHASDFLADVITNRKAWRGGDGSVLGRNGSGFASLWPENKGYNEYKAFEERLEGFIRDSLVNPILEDLFRAADMGFDLRKPEEKLAFASNRFYEEYCECEFIVGTADSKVGYRYTHPSPAWVDIQRFIEREKLDCVVVIDWSDMGESEPKKVETTPENRRYFEKVYELSAGSFLAGHFPKEVRESFTVKVGDAIAKANELLGFRTIHSPSPSNMPGIKRRVLDSLREYEEKPKR